MAATRRAGPSCATEELPTTSDTRAATTTFGAVPLYPTALSVALAVQLLAANGTSPFAALRTLAVAAVLALVLSAVGRLVLGDRDRGGVFGVLAVVAVMAGNDLRMVAVAMAGIALLLVEGVALAKAKRPVNWSRVGLVMSGLTAILVLAIGIQSVQAGLPGAVARALAEEGPAYTRSDLPPATPDAPDVYLLLLDGYARADVLERVFDYADPLPAELADRGFTVATRSRANYPLTAHTLASMFNLGLLADVESTAPLVTPEPTVNRGFHVKRAINDNEAFDLLRRQGYVVHGLSSGFEQVALREADTFFDSGELNEFEIGMVRRTLFRHVLNAAAPDLVSAQQRSRIENLYERLMELAGEPSGQPRFILGHLPVPHAPWVYHADGSPRTVPDVDAFYGDTPATTRTTEAELKAGYLGAVRSLHPRILEVIDAIDERSERPAAVIVFSDHGPWIGADGGDLRLRFLTLFAAKLPEGASPFPDDLSLVQVMPILLNELFEAGIPVLETAPSYAFRNGNEYDLFEVSDPNKATAGAASGG